MNGRYELVKWAKEAGIKQPTKRSTKQLYWYWYNWKLNKQ
jgi:hypothetical protein